MRITFRLPQALTLAFFVALASACAEPPTINPEDQGAQLAEVICEHRTECACETLDDLQPAECTEDYSKAIQGELSALAEGLDFDTSCMDVYDRFLSAFDCDSSLGVDGDEAIDAFLACKLVYGDAQPGEECEVHTDLTRAVGIRIGDTCVQGSWCFASSPVVTPSCVALPSLGDPCPVNSNICPSGSACLDPDADGESRCVAASTPQEACNPDDGSRACSAGYRCHPETRTCELYPGPGEACAEFDACISGAMCFDGLCVDLPDEGESCLGDCAPGLFCEFGNTLCVAMAGLDEDCSSTPCADGLRCENDRCVEERLLCKVLGGPQ